MQQPVEKRGKESENLDSVAGMAENANAKADANAHANANVEEPAAALTRQATGGGGGGTVKRSSSNVAFDLERRQSHADRLNEILDVSN